MPAAPASKLGRIIAIAAPMMHSIVKTTGSAQKEHGRGCAEGVFRC